VFAVIDLFIEWLFYGAVM